MLFMGLLNEMFTGSEDEVRRLSPDQSPSAAGYRTIDFKGMTDVEVGSLDGMVTGSSFREVLDGMEVVLEGDEGPWVFRVRPVFVAALGRVEDDAIPQLADRWGDTEEIQASPSDKPFLADLIREIRAQAREATNQGHDLFLWVSL